MSHAVFIVEDHPLMREMLAGYIEALPSFSVCDAVRTAEEALDWLPGSADLVLVDVSLPTMSGIDLVAEIGARWPALPCLVCSGHDEAHYVERAIAAGARGYVAKGNPAELAEGLQCVMNGDEYLSVSLRERVEAHRAPTPDENCGPIDLPDADLVDSPDTDRSLDVG